MRKLLILLLLLPSLAYAGFIGGGVTDHGNLSGLGDDDHTIYGKLADAETIAGNWVNTANPWADNEVADNITLTNLTQITNRASTSLSDTASLLYETELDSEAELETQIADVTDVLTSNDGGLKTTTIDLSIDRDSVDASQVDVSYTGIKIEEYYDENGTFTIDIDAGTGANKLDTGTLVNGTWYALYVIYNPTTSVEAGLASASFTSPTMPSGYTKKRRIGAGYYIDATNKIRNFNYKGGGMFFYETQQLALNGGTSTTFTDVNLSAYLPQTSYLFAGVFVAYDTNGAQALADYRSDGTSADFHVRALSNTFSTGSQLYVMGNCPTSSSQIIEYKISVDDQNTSAYVIGYLDTIT